MTTASAVIPAHLRTDVEALWNYHDMHHELRRTDAGIGLGSHDAGVAMAAFYALRLYQKTMHNRLPDGCASREMTLRDGFVLVPLVTVIVAISLYPTLILKRGEASVQDKLGAVAAATTDEVVTKP